METKNKPENVVKEKEEKKAITDENKTETPEVESSQSVHAEASTEVELDETQEVKNEEKKSIIQRIKSTDYRTVEGMVGLIGAIAITLVFVSVVFYIVTELSSGEDTKSEEADTYERPASYVNGNSEIEEIEIDTKNWKLRKEYSLNTEFVYPSVFEIKTSGNRAEGLIEISSINQKPEGAYNTFVPFMTVTFDSDFSRDNIVFSSFDKSNLPGFETLNIMGEEYDVYMSNVYDCSYGNCEGNLNLFGYVSKDNAYFTVKFAYSYENNPNEKNFVAGLEEVYSVKALLESFSKYTFPEYNYGYDHNDVYINSYPNSYLSPNSYPNSYIDICDGPDWDWRVCM